MKYLYLLFAFIFSYYARAGNEPSLMGANTISLGRAYTGVRGNLWAYGYNPAGITGLQSAEVGFFAEQRFGLKELTYGGITFAVPFKDKHFIGAEMGSFGYSNYKENKFSIGYATTLLKVLNIGTKINVANVSIPGQGNAASSWLDIGLNANITKSLNLGVSIYNVNQAKLKTQYEKENMPTVLTAGIAYAPSDKIMIVADAAKSSTLSGVSFRGGLQYRLAKGFTARAGATTKPTSLNFGAGWQWKEKIAIDIAGSLHQTLGFTPAFSLSWKFGKKKEQGIGNKE